MFYEILLKYGRNSIETKYKATNDYLMTIFDYYLTILSIGKKSLIDLISSIYTFSYSH